MGLCSYYRRFAAKFVELARPLHRLVEKGTRFTWTKKCQDTFVKLKGCLTSTPILAYPTGDRIFHLDMDASQEGLGAVLSQAHEGVERVITYYIILK